MTDKDLNVNNSFIPCLLDMKNRILRKALSMEANIWKHIYSLQEEIFIQQGARFVSYPFYKEVVKYKVSNESYQHYPSTNTP